MSSQRGFKTLKDIPQNPSIFWLKRQCGCWLMNLKDFDLRLSEYFFRCLDWVTGDLSGMAAEIKKNFKFQAQVKSEINNARKNMATWQTDSGRDLAISMEIFYKRHSALRDEFRKSVFTILERRINEKRPAISIFPRGFKTIFNLDENSLKIIAYAWGLGNCRPMEELFEDDLELNSIENAPILACFMGIPQSKLTQLLLRLYNQGILDQVRHNMIRLTDNINTVLNLGKTARVQDYFCKSLPATDVPMEQFQISEEEKKHALKLLKRKGSEPVHLLLYGPPGTGKTSFAAQLIQRLKVKCWSVSCNEMDSGRDRRVSLTACINMALTEQGAVVVVDEAERILDTGFDESSSSKAWLNELLEKKNLKIIWITNQIEHIDQAVRRRFSFSIHFNSLGVRESAQMWSNVAARLNVSKRFPEEKREFFARAYHVPVAVMENVTKQAKALAGKNNFCECAELILESYMRLSNDGNWISRKKKIMKDYEPRAICASLPVDKLVTRFKALGARIAKESLAGMGNILFYGPPGTGKTAFAHYLAEELEMECVTKRASDILGSYVGETERAIAAFFSEAQLRKTLLVIDEADSFLASREDAARSWERTMVNEFLTALENHRGLCICSTNFRSIMDSAAMRRFPFKVEFRYVSSEGALMLYDKMLAPLTREKLDGASKARLCSLKRLTPGDFRSVLTQFWIEDPKDVSCARLVEALAKEEKLKLDKAAKTIGFNL